MTLSGSSASSEAIMSQLMASMKNGPFQQDEAYWKDFASKWTRKIEDKVMEVYAPIYQQHMTLDELKKVVAFYESPAGRKLGETATAVATESMPMIQQLSMEMVQEMMPKLYRAANGIIRVKIITAMELSDETMDKIKEFVRRHTDKTIEFVHKVDPSIIGGFILQIGSRQLDASLMKELKEMSLQFGFLDYK